MFLQKIDRMLYLFIFLSIVNKEKLDTCLSVFADMRLLCAVAEFMDPFGRVKASLKWG